MQTFAKSVRHAALTRVERSESLRRAYRQRRRWWHSWSVQLLAITTAIPFFLFVGVIFGTVAAFACLGPIAAAVLDEKPLANPFPTNLGLAAHAFAVTGLLAFPLLCSGRKEFVGELWRRAYLPVADRARLWDDTSFLGALCAVAFIVARIFLIVAEYHHLPWTGYAAMIPLAALQAWMLYVVAILAADWFRPDRILREAMGSVLLLSGLGYAAAMLTAAFSRWVPEHLQQIVAGIGLFSPLGWADAIVWHGVVGGQSWPWLLLVPCIALSVWAIRRRPHLLAIHEIRISSLGACRAILADEIDDSVLPSPIAPVEKTTASAPTVADRHAVLRRLLKMGELVGSDWSDQWLLERWFGRVLSPRDRQVIECLRGGAPTCNWTLPWLCFPLLVIVWTAFFGWLLFVAPDKDRGALAIMFLLPAWAALAEWPKSIQRNTSALTALPVFPIGLREMIAAELKLATLRLAAWLPLLALYLLASGWLIGLRLGLLACGITSVAAAMLAIGLIGACIRLGSRTRLEFSVYRYVYLVPLALCFPCAMGMVMCPLWFITVPLAATLLVVVAGETAFFDWLHRTGRLDYRAEPFQERTGSSLRP
jgi:hypothetical protein